MEVILIGTSGSTITANRTTTSILIDDDLLIDVGEGATQKLLKIGAFKSIRTILISHLHVDHFIGIFTFLWKKWLSGNSNTITIYGPPKIQATIEKIFELTSTPVEHFPYKIHYKPLDPGESIEKVGEISATRVKHPVYTLAYRIDRDKSICFSSDTEPLDKMVTFSKGCDLLIHDCSMPNSMAEKAHSWTHSTPKDAAEIATKAGVKKLVVFHILSELEDQMAQCKQDAQDFFEGEVILAEDMKKFKI